MDGPTSLPSRYVLSAPGYGCALAELPAWDKVARPARIRGLRRGGKGFDYPEDGKDGTVCFQKMAMRAFYAGMRAWRLHTHVLYRGKMSYPNAPITSLRTNMDLLDVSDTITSF